MDRTQCVNYIWSRSQEIRDWYRQEHNFDLDNIPVSEYRTYGVIGSGDLIDLIISDGITDRLVIEDEDGSYIAVEDIKK